MTDEALLESQVTYLYNASAKELYNLALYSIGDQPLAEQLVIEAFVSVYNRLLDKSEVTRFRIKSARKLYRLTKKLLINSTWELNKYESFEFANDKNRINSLLNRLTYDERFLLLLFLQQKFSQKQIAQIISIPRFIVKKRLCRTLSKTMNMWAK